jgi:hypothetical protein
MDIESTIRTRIESILLNHQRNREEVRSALEDDAATDSDGFEEERELYDRVIASYRSALGEMNGLLDEHIGFLSAFYHVIESIKDSRDFRAICARVVGCVVDRFGAEYCSLIFPTDQSAGEEGICVEGVSETQKFIRIHSQGRMLGSETLEREVLGMALETSQAIVVEDVYKEARFKEIDFPGVMRSVAVVPILQESSITGFLLVSHSLPRYFTDRHLRVLRVLGSLLAHLRYLAADEAPALSQADRSAPVTPDTLSIVLLDFETRDPFGRRIALPRDTVGSVRRALLPLLGARDSLVFHEDGLLALLPGTSEKLLPGRVSAFRAEFRRWRTGQKDRFRGSRMNAGFSHCDGEGDLTRALEIAGHVMHPERDDTQEAAAVR